jgi:hypothetical protein
MTPKNMIRLVYKLDALIIGINRGEEGTSVLHPVGIVNRNIIS